MFNRGCCIGNNRNIVKSQHIIPQIHYPFPSEVMKTTHSDSIVVIVGNVAKRRTVEIESSVTTAERTPSERMKHTCNTANTAVVYLVQGRVGSCRADTGN